MEGVKQVKEEPPLVYNLWCMSLAVFESLSIHLAFFYLTAQNKTMLSEY